MNIGMVLDYVRDWPPGIRAEKESIALSKEGHKIFALTPRYNKELPYKEYIEKVKTTVVRVDVSSTKGTYLANAIRAITLYDKRFKEHLRSYIKENAIDALHVHDIWLIKVALEVADEFGIPVVADLHENMPAAMIASRAEYPFVKRLIASFFWNYQLMRWQEKFMLKRCAHTLIVVEEADFRLKEYGLDERKYSVVSNTEDETTFKFNPSEADSSILAEYKNNFVISYVGGMGIHRGLDTVIKALPYIKDRIENLKLVIVGADSKSQDQILEMVKMLNIKDYVDVISWQPFHKVNSYVMASDVCLVPHNDFEHTQTTIPHKLFQYMICGKPVLVSDCKPLKRIVEKANSGKIFKANDSKHLASVIEEMYHNKESLIEYGKNGQRMALNEFSWKHDAKRLVDVYKLIETEHDRKQNK